ncbi:hypothetical protein AHF37_07689 [Paragonimus kellicotti]|nr:hypothetical protein AHF37_07689 [Paragonimus kellicotti]
MDRSPSYYCEANCAHGKDCSSRLIGHAPGYVPQPVHGLWQESCDYVNEVLAVKKNYKRERSTNAGVRVNLGFNDTSSLESIFGHLSVSPSTTGSAHLIESSRRHKSRSSEPRIVKVARKSFDTLDVSKDRRHERHLKVNPELLAQQMTLIELKFFQAIKPELVLSVNIQSRLTVSDSTTVHCMVGTATIIPSIKPVQNPNMLRSVVYTIYGWLTPVSNQTLADKDSVMETTEGDSIMEST